MVKLYDGGVYLVGGETIVTDPAQLASLCGRNVTREEAEKELPARVDVQEIVGDKQIVKIIFVPGRLCNLIVK